MQNSENIFGLVGKQIAYSFSRKYFNEKFKQLELYNYKYVNFDISEIEKFPKILKEHKQYLRGMNVTIPYKEEVIAYLDELDKDANIIGAVNTIKILENGKTKGFNTDVFGFEKSLEPLVNSTTKHALILGTGGASKAVAFVLEKLGINYKYVSRLANKSQSITYRDLNESLMKSHSLIVNCTPLGTHPNIEDCPDIPYQFITKNHALFDLIYNPPLTSFLAKGKSNGAQIKNGKEMLELQAEKAWEVWNH